MAKKSSNSGVRDMLNLVVWVAGVLVSLAVGFGMIDGTLSIPWGGLTMMAVTGIAGWVVVILALLGVVLAIVDRFG
jgi:hypothetical protein